jgi:hypothetical protein
MGERVNTLRLLDSTPGAHPKPVGADKAYDTCDFVAGCRTRNITPHIARHARRWGGSAINGRTTRHMGYQVSQTIRARIEEHFGWTKTVGHIPQAIYRGLRRIYQHFKLTITASNLSRMARRLFYKAIPSLAIIHARHFLLTQGHR